jgi:ATP-dependent RNA helicase SUPV3L1/SUV3
MRVLRLLARHPDVLALANDEAQVSLVWDVCRIPNYEKRLPEHQVERLLPLLGQRLRHGRLLDAYLHEQVRRLERYDGDIDSLLQRLAAVRTWTYVSHQSGWVVDPRLWQERTRALEDKLGDLLHERLVERFVRTRTAIHWSIAPVPAKKLAAVSGNHAFAKLAELDIYQRPEREARERHGDWVEQLVAAHFEAFSLDAVGDIHFEGERVARLGSGQLLLRPTLKLMLPEWVDPGARRRIERRLLAHTKDIVVHLLEPLFPEDRTQMLEARANAPLRGLLYQLEQGLGTVARSQVAPQLQNLSDAEKAALRLWNIELGCSTVFASAMLTQERLLTRAALWAAARSERKQEPLAVDALAWPLTRTLDRDSCLRLGFVPLIGWAVRCDVLEQLVTKLAGLVDKSPDASAEEARILLGCSDQQARAIVRELPRRRRRRRRQRPAARGPLSA